MGNRGWIRVIPYDKAQNPERVWNFYYQHAGGWLSSIISRAWELTEAKVVGYSYSWIDLFPLMLAQVSIDNSGQCWLGNVGTLPDNPAVFIHLPQFAGNDPQVELFDVGADHTRRLRWSGSLHAYLNGATDRLDEDEPQVILGTEILMDVLREIRPTPVEVPLHELMKDDD